MLRNDAQVYFPQNLLDEIDWVLVVKNNLRAKKIGSGQLKNQLKNLLRNDTFSPNSPLLL